MRERGGGEEGGGSERGEGEKVSEGVLGPCHRSFVGVLCRSWRGVLDVSLSSLGVVVPPLFHVGGVLRRFAA